MSSRNLKLIIESLVEDILCEDEASKDYIKDINLKQLKKGQRPEPDEDPKQFFNDLQARLEPEAEKGPIFDKDILKIIETVPFKMDKKETQWVANLAKAGHNINLRKLRDMLDFVRQTKTDISKYKNFDDPLKDSEEWHEQFKLKDKPEEELGDYETNVTVMTFPSGYKIVEVPSKDLETEGKKMGHCVGGYCDVVESGETIIYSLRDKKNEPHVTFEWDLNFGRFEQIQGKENKDPVKKYHPFIRDFALKMGDKVAAIEYGHKLTAKDYTEIITSDDTELKREVALRSKTPKKVLIKLALDKNSSVREYVAANPNTPKDVLAALATSPKEYVVAAAAQNPSTPPDALIAIASSQENNNHLKVAKNPNAPSEALAKLSNSNGRLVRELVANHPNTSKEILEKLANDTSPYVSQAAERTLEARAVRASAAKEVAKAFRKDGYDV